MAPSPRMPKGPIFFVNNAAKATMQMTKLFQSMKFSGVASPRAAVPMSPSTAGFKPVITPFRR